MHRLSPLPIVSSLGSRVPCPPRNRPQFMGKVFAHVASRNNDTPVSIFHPLPRFYSQNIRSKAVPSRENYSFLRILQQPLCPILWWKSFESRVRRLWTFVPSKRNRCERGRLDILFLIVWSVKERDSLLVMGIFEIMK